jgi:hypothetical protein
VVYAPRAPLIEPRSSPPETCWHAPAANVAEHPMGIMEIRRDATPGEFRTWAVMESGRRLKTAWRY